jgi:hypothetical protein
MQRVIVHIDHLVLKGFRHEDRHAFASGLQEELTRQLAESTNLQGLVDRGNLSKLTIYPVSVKAEANAGQLGVSAAKGITKGMAS